MWCFALRNLINPRYRVGHYRAMFGDGWRALISLVGQEKSGLRWSEDYTSNFVYLLSLPGCVNDYLASHSLKSILYFNL